MGDLKEFALWNYADWAAAISVLVLTAFLVGGALAITRPKEEVLGHPKGLYMLFFAEMWERFSYYGMRALLTLYLVKHWLFDDSSSNLIYGAYTSLVYITPVLGGWLADKYLGQRKAVLFGAVLLTAGHFFMAFEGDGSGYANDPTVNIFWLALALIIVGSGFLKANISVMVGQLYPRTDIRRDSAYTIFYMGINLGAAAGVLIAAYIGETVSWAWGFGLAGFGMLLGLLVFVLGKSLLRGNGEPPVPAKLKEKVAGINFEWMLYAVGLVGVAVIWALIQYQEAVGWILLVSGILLLGYVLQQALYKLPGEDGKMSAGSTSTIFYAGVVTLLVTAGLMIAQNGAGPISNIIGIIGLALVIAACFGEAKNHDNFARDRVFAMIFVILLMPLFWGLFEQAGGSMNLYTDRHVDRGGIPTTFFQSINPIYIIILAPIFAALWQWMARSGWEPSAIAKMGLGIVQMGLAFVVFVWGAQQFSVTGEAGALLTPVLFLFLFYLLSTTGELCLSPVGLSAINRLSARHMASLMMAAFFFGTAGGNYVAGFMGSLMGEGEGGDMTREAALEVYWAMGLVAVGVGIFVTIVSPLVKRLMHLDALRDDTVGDDLMGQAEGPGEAQGAGMHPETKG
ncbi:peptide MFS transporter [Aurantiacibacter gangjinensis]|uniref:MFS transporter n=1 Tax=Aurantiacibacter gangjinensis TaxID=502682 RepID=A0A0G9ML94_9SPHN|nr:oligopeptide:H+ symporter [Aurantiacibacter gangjinensis]APE27382.1 Di-/tripeptide transporter [Aurantiacibacter gangjinensis]KLE31465.1 MFS transporter [Aurantiacibacter gangjinensis]